MEVTGYRPGEAGFRRVSIALFAGSFASFGLLYCVQPLLPEFSRVFDISPAAATLSISFCTVALGIGLLIAGPLSDAFGRTTIMRISLVLAAVMTGLCAVAPSWSVLLALRAITGLLLAGFPAVAMAYLREEVHPSAHARSAGLYVAGNALGGVTGRLVTGGLTELGDWHLAMLGTGVFTLACAVLVVVLLPQSRRFQAADRGLRASLRGYARVLREPALLGLYAIAFVCMGAFVAMFNIAGFRLESAPYLLPIGLAGLIYLTYPVGSIASVVAGRVADRLGRAVVVTVGFIVALAGMVITTAAPLWAFVTGLTVVTVGFFVVHAVASGWVSAHAYPRGLSTGSAASAYMFAYYLGSTIFGAIAGGAWRSGGWGAVTWMNLGLLGAGLVVAIALRGSKPEQIAS